MSRQQQVTLFRTLVPTTVEASVLQNFLLMDLGPLATFQSVQYEGRTMYLVQACRSLNQSDYETLTNRTISLIQLRTQRSMLLLQQRQAQLQRQRQQQEPRQQAQAQAEAEALQQRQQRRDHLISHLLRDEEEEAIRQSHEAPRMAEEARRRLRAIEEEAARLGHDGYADDRGEVESTSGWYSSSGSERSWYRGGGYGRRRRRRRQVQRQRESDRQG